MCTLLKFARQYRVFLRSLIALLAIWTGSSFASESFDSIQIHGFISQGFFLSTDNNLHGNSSSSRGTLELTEMGINGSVLPFNNLRLAAQAIYRRDGQVSDAANIDYLLADWTMMAHENYQLGVRLGRVKNPFGLFNDTRDVSFTRPSIMMPSLYQERARDLFLSSDGGQLYLDMSTSFGDFSLQVNGGRLKNNPKELEISLFSSDLPGSLKSNPSYMGKLEYENKNGSTRLAFSYAKVEMEYQPGAAFDLANGDLSFELLLFSAQQHLGDITLTAEYLRMHNSLTNLEPFPDFKPTSESYYLQANYQINPQLQAIVRYDVAYSNIDDRNGDDYANQTFNPNYAAYSKDYMVGLRWALKGNWLLQAEYHRLDGVSEVSFADNTDQSKLKQHWNLFALQLSYRF